MQHTGELGKGLHTLQGYLKAFPGRELSVAPATHLHHSTPPDTCSWARDCEATEAVAGELQLGRLGLWSEASLSPG